MVVGTTNAACGASDGTVTLGAITGGTGPFSYSFNGGAFTAITSYTGLAAAVYPVCVKDVNGCQFCTTATVTTTIGPTAITITPVNATCGGANGTITLSTVTGGVAPYTYSH